MMTQPTVSPFRVVERDAAGKCAVITIEDVCRIFVQHGAAALPSSPCFVGHARRANKEAEYLGMQAGWDYIYWAARIESSRTESELVAAAHQSALA